MARYIDADELKERLEDFSKWCRDGRKQGVDFVLDCPLPNIPNADVIPRAEVEKLQEVNADLNESLRLASEANKDLQVELQAMRGAANSYKVHYESLAREIFEELDKKIFHKIPDLYTLEIYKELKKKYTEATP